MHSRTFVEVVEGNVIGAYRILKRIGEGGMGSVWLAEHSMLGRRAAIKVLHNEFATKPEIVTRFFNEARAATAIADPGIVQIFDFGHASDGSAYIVMELLDGEPLDQRVAHTGVLELPHALRIMRQVASTLGAAHARGIVHRDLKPENIFIVRDPEVVGGERAKVLDFGIAKLGEMSSVKTQTSAVMGTPTYMSPEQCRGAGHVDQRSDVYALGCVLYRLLCGRPPFDAEGVGDLIVMHLREPPQPPSQLRPGLPVEVEHVIMRCLAKDPAQRFASGAELAVALGALTGSSPVLPAPAGAFAAASHPTTLSSSAGAASSTTTAPARRSRMLPIAASVIAAGAAVAIVLVVKRGGDSTAPHTASSAPDPAAVGSQSNAASHVTTPPPPVVAAPTPPDPKVQVTPRMKAVLDRFTSWSREHAGAPCPQVSDLATDANDPWGHPFKVTCADQPVDQIVGLVSAGPDGTFGTVDDVTSWTLGRDVTDLVRGERWKEAAAEPVAVKASAAPSRTPRPKAPAPASSKTTPTKRNPSTTNPGSVDLDENGLPISR